MLKSISPRASSVMRLFLQDYVSIQLGRLRGMMSEEVENNFKQNVSMPLSPETFARIEQLLRAGDAQGLFSLSKEYAPFYCRSCQGVYCPRHWRLEGVWESDSHWFEGWQGICPYGHSHFIDG